MHIWHITFFGNSGHEKNSSYWYRIYFRFCVRKLFFEDSYLAHDHGTIRQYFFIAIAAWWRSYFSPTSRQNSLLFRCERISSLISLLQIICIRMQCWLDDRVFFYLSRFTSSNRRRGTARKKENEEHWDFIASTPERHRRRRMWVSFYCFLRQVSENTILPVPLWILMRATTLFARTFDAFTSLHFV
jgi:hypothetical protein